MLSHRAIMSHRPCDSGGVEANGHKDTRTVTQGNRERQWDQQNQLDGGVTADESSGLFVSLVLDDWHLLSLESD